MPTLPSPSRRHLLVGGASVLAATAAPAWLTPALAQPSLRPTPSQTEGPFYPVALPADNDFDLLRTGSVTYGKGQPASGAGGGHCTTFDLNGHAQLQVIAAQAVVIVVDDVGGGIVVADAIDDHGAKPRNRSRGVAAGAPCARLSRLVTATTAAAGGQAGNQCDGATGAQPGPAPEVGLGDHGLDRGNLGVHGCSLGEMGGALGCGAWGSKY